MYCVITHSSRDRYSCLYALLCFVLRTVIANEGCLFSPDCLEGVMFLEAMYVCLFVYVTSYRLNRLTDFVLQGLVRFVFMYKMF